MRLDGFRIHAAKQRIARAANLVARDAVASHHRGEQSARGAVHRIDDKAEIGGAHLFPIHELFDSLEIRRQNIERMNLIGARRQQRARLFGQSRSASSSSICADDGGQRRASVAGLELDSVPARRIVAGGDHDAAGGATLAHQQRKRRRRARRCCEPHRECRTSRWFRRRPAQNALAPKRLS